MLQKLTTVATRLLLAIPHGTAQELIGLNNLRI